jgi:hypothetical protein
MSQWGAWYTQAMQWKQEFFFWKDLMTRDVPPRIYESDLAWQVYMPAWIGTMILIVALLYWIHRQWWRTSAHAWWKEGLFQCSLIFWMMWLLILWWAYPYLM